MALFEPQRHEPLTDVPWDEREARAAIARIVADAHRAFTEKELWPIHPMDRSPERADTLKPIYYGAAGVIWALNHLAASGLAEPARDYRPTVSTLLERHRQDSLRLTGQPILGYPTGDAGILLLHFASAPSEALARELHDVIDANVDHPSRGLGWGAPGSMLAACFMFERTRDARWKALYVRLFEELWRTWEYDDALGCHLFTSDLYGAREKRLGGLHGLAGSLACMLRGRDLLPADRDRELVRRARRALCATAVREGGHANWPMSLEFPALWLQHCSGAPGFVNCLSSLPADSSEPETDALLLAAGELIWRAGPVTKLPSLCHGVSGSGYALLKLFARTGDDVFRMRARRFAMHGIAQAERGVKEHGQRKFSLWTGDLGLAIFVGDCILGRDQFPTLDVF